MRSRFKPISPIMVNEGVMVTFLQFPIIHLYDS